MVSSMAASGTAGHYARTPAGAASAAPQVFDQSVGPQSSASASSPAPATILMLVKDAANGAAASTENGTSTPPRSAPRSPKHRSEQRRVGTEGVSQCRAR